MTNAPGSPPQEIERTYLLRGVPPIPGGAVVWRIEQGYLPDPPPGGAAGEVVEGRLRRTVTPGGAVVCTHTVKRGEGLVRTEVEREVPEPELARLWPRTEGRRLRKTRHRVREGAFTWEVDVFEGFDLVLAEVELPSAGTQVTPPAWLAPFVVRDVTDEPGYRNFHLATRGPPRS